MVPLAGMNDNSLIARGYRKARYVVRRYSGLPAQGVVFVTPENAHEVASRHAGVQAECLIERAPATTLVSMCLPGDELPGLQPFEVELQTVLLDIQNTAFSFRNHLLFDGDRHALFPAVAEASQVLFRREYVPRRVQHLAGTVAYLSNTWVDNYYHWLQLTLPFIRLYRQMRPECRIDHYYVGESRIRSLQVETLARLGIGEEQIVTRPCTGDRMLAALCRRPVQHCGFNYRDVFGHDFVRSLFVPPAEMRDRKGPARLYVTRGQAHMRRILNEPELIAFLGGHGFSPVSLEGRSVAEQADLFWQAEAIVGMHGAALTNLIFARPGTTVVEIFPFEFHEPGMFTAAAHSHVNYHHLRGRPLAQHDDAQVLAAQHTVVDLDKLSRLLTLTRLDTRAAIARQPPAVSVDRLRAC
jgi:capsular polysaccharide biosynthesis protein